MKSIDIVNKLMAKKLNKPLHIIAAVNSHYWKTSRAKLVALEPTTLYWKHLGSITISKYKLYSEMQKLIDKIRAVGKSEKYRQESKDRLIKVYTDRLKVLLVHRNNLAKDGYDKRLLLNDPEGIEESDEDIESSIDDD